MVTVWTGRPSELANGLEHVLLKKLLLWDPEIVFLNVFAIKRKKKWEAVVAMGEGSLRPVACESVIAWEEVSPLNLAY